MQDSETEVIPIYRVEVAKSGRSSCVQTGKKAKKCGDEVKIDQGELRVGSFNRESGTYG